MRRMRAPEFVSFFKVPQFDAQNRSLYSVHPGVPADHRVVIFANLSVVPKDPYLLLQLMVAGHNCTRLSECAEILSGVEAEATGVAEQACPAPFVFGSMSLRRVFDHKQSAGTRNLQDRIHVCRLAEKVHGNDGLRSGR